ncbi:Asp23/Gls24 family envelope stress response protein [Pseudonocardia sp. GCM10023141]|uniref:Asp23/Gls24 family envelope stress response protein n=1 Tax=Pseudonocardia sp. GCM10023141 TaxID=3252653 RepID=UPI0036181F98
MTLHVGETAVARIAGLAARRVPGVVALPANIGQALLGMAGTFFGTDRLRPPTDGVRAEVDGTTATVTVSVVTQLGHNCRDLAQAVQREVAAEVAAVTGLEAIVTVTVTDVLLD